MRIVLDTNVFVSGVFFTGPPYQMLRAWRDGALHLVVSPEILEEYQRMGEELAAQFPQIDLQPFLHLLITHARLCRPIDLPAPVCADPDDDKFLACALGGRVRTIVSGDAHLLQVNGYRRRRILRPRAFVEEFLDQQYRR